MRPAAYEISGCSCGNTDPDWSEYQGRLWCATCQIDFIPENSGIFDGPIPVNAMALMGIDMRRYEIATGKIEEISEWRGPENGDSTAPKSQPEANE